MDVVCVSSFIKMIYENLEHGPDAGDEGEEEDEERAQRHDVAHGVVGRHAQHGQQHEAQQAHQHAVPVLPAACAHTHGHADMESQMP